MEAKSERKTPITFNGETAYYSDVELEELASFPQTPEGENAARLVHEGKVHGDAELLPSGPRITRGRFG